MDEWKIITPFGEVKFPKPSLPTEPPKFDERRRKILNHAIAIDLSSVIGWIPVVGDIVADVVEDVHGAELKKLMTAEEYEEYLKQDKVAPSTIAVIRTFQRK